MGGRTTVFINRTPWGYHDHQFSLNLIIGKRRWHVAHGDQNENVNCSVGCFFIQLYIREANQKKSLNQISVISKHERKLIKNVNPKIIINKRTAFRLGSGSVNLKCSTMLQDNRQTRFVDDTAVRGRWFWLARFWKKPIPCCFLQFTSKLVK